MEHCAKGFGAIGQLLSEPLPTISVGWHISNHSVQRTEVICPQPVRPTRTPSFMDNPNRFYCRPKSLNVHQRQTDKEILDFILSRDEPDEDSDSNPHSRFYCGSPPARTSNPVIRDAEFGKHALPVLSPLGNSPSLGGKPSPRVERGVVPSSSCGRSSSSSSYTSNPKIRIEGFSSANSDTRRVVSALA